MAAIALFDKGLNNSEIGRPLKVCNQTVSRGRRQFQKAAGGACSRPDALDGSR